MVPATSSFQDLSGTRREKRRLQANSPSEESQSKRLMFRLEKPVGGSLVPPTPSPGSHLQVMYILPIMRIPGASTPQG